MQSQLSDSTGWSFWFKDFGVSAGASIEDLNPSSIEIQIFESNDPTLVDGFLNDETNFIAGVD